MAEKGYSAFGLDPYRLRDVLRPLLEQVTKMEGARIQDRRESFLYYQLVDAYLSAECLLLLSDAGLNGNPVGMGAIEVITRRLIEQAIVVRYVHASANESVIDSYLKTSAHEWERAWGSSGGTSHSPIPVKGLHPYRKMAEAIDPELAAVYSKLSYLSHPRGAFPYAFRVSESLIEANEYFKLNLAATCAWVDIAVRHILYPYRGDPGPSHC